MWKKQSIKISLIAIVAIGIVAAIIIAINSIGDGGKGHISNTKFKKYIHERAEKEIAGKDYEEARKSFNDLLNEINTEASITLGDGSKNLSALEERKCKEIVFYEYVPIFTKYGTSYFDRQSWDDATIKGLRDQVTTLLNMKIAESGKSTFSALNNIKSTVDDYYAAWNVANSASHCSSVAAISEVTQRANKYRHKPLSNNASLAAALNSVESTAKSAVIRNISGHCHVVASRYDRYANYAEWTSAYDQACKRIDDYKDRYGYPDELRKARNLLDNTDDMALNYYSRY